MQGLEIFIHSIKMVLRNLLQAFQITLVPALIGAAAIVFVSVVFGVSLETLPTGSNPDVLAAETEGAPAAFGVFLLFLLVFFFLAFWIVVNWHRFILLEEFPRGWMPPFHGDRIAAYFLRILLLLLVGLVLMLPLALIGLIFAAAPGLGAALMIVAMIAVGIVTYRLSVILPAAAIGQPIGLSQAWEATRGSTWTIVVLFVVSFLFQVLIQALAAMLALVPVLGTIVVLIVGLFILPLINVSILTTMYGVFVEGRALR